ncbi:TorF family putative porin [Flavobacterium magnum]|nr:TorF family putative porin [Flavobacterium magnum]
MSFILKRMHPMLRKSLSLLLLAGLRLFAQNTEGAERRENTDRKWEAAIDFQSRYIWRGQAYGGSTTAVQPSFAYNLIGELTVGIWATQNFRCKDYHTDGTSDGYREFDFGLDYQFADFLSFGLWQYYWPALQQDLEADTRFFNYSTNSVTTVDAGLTFDFSEDYRLAFQAALNTFIAGNDFRYDSAGDNPVQNFTTYAEIGYVFKDVFDRISTKTFRSINITPVVGAVLNNQAAYYAAGDYNKISFINLAVAASREFDLGFGVSMPVTINYTHNGAAANTSLEGRDFLTATVSIKY